MPRKESPMLRRVRERIETMYAADPECTFTTETFHDIVVTLEDRKALRTDFCKRSDRKSSRTQSLKKVGMTRGRTNSRLNVYGVERLPLVNLNTRVPSGKPPRVRIKRQTMSDKETDDLHRLTHSPTPEPVVDLQNILFGMRGTNV